MSDVSAPAVRRGGLLSRAVSHTRTKIGLGLTFLALAVAFLGPLASPFPPDEVSSVAFSRPGGEHLLGTDFLGQDVLSRVLHGGTSLVVSSLAATLIGMVLGVALGLMAGYSRGWLDPVLLWLMDVVLAFPYFVLVLLFVSMAGTELWLVVLLVGVIHMPRVARLTRAVTRETIDLEYVQSAEAIALPRWRILVGEILPNLSTPLLVELGLRLTWSVMLIASLSFLGFGVQPPAVDWGLMIGENRTGLAVQQFAVLAPITLIAALTVGVNLIADGVGRAISDGDR